MATKQLTERQRRVYELIRRLIVNRGYGPTVREIGEAFGIKSPNGVMCHLRALERKGLIRRSPNKSRAIELVDAPDRGGTSLPMAGQVAAGVAPLAF
ncbi:MAG: repressor LexA, partial [Planctomycetota bacterium]